MAKSYDIEKIKARVSLLDVLNEFGIEHKYVNHKLKFLCQAPGHPDRHIGSCMNKKNDPDKWICFACNKTGDVIDLTQYHFGVNKNEALKILSERFGVGAIEDEPKRVERARLSEKDYAKLFCETKPVTYIVRETDFRQYETAEKMGFRMRDLYLDDPELHDNLLLNGYYEAVKYHSMAALLLPEETRGEALKASISELRKLMKKGLKNKSLYENEKRSTTERAPAA